MKIKKAIIFFLIISFRINSAMIGDFEESPCQQPQFFDDAQRTINCNALKRFDNEISWNMKKMSEVLSLSDNDSPFVFKFSDLLVHILIRLRINTLLGNGFNIKKTN